MKFSVNTKRLSERGNIATIIVVAVLAVGILAALGFVFYQNYAQQKEEQARKAAEAQQVDHSRHMSTATIDFNGTKYEIDHPMNWQAKTIKLAGSKLGGTATTITNSDKTVRVNVSISELEKSTSCDTQSGLRIGYYNVHDKPMSKLSSTPLYLVETITDHSAEGYDYAVGLVPDSGDTHAAVGQSRCNVARIGHATDPVMAADGQAIVTPAVLVTIDFPKLPALPEPASKDMQSIKAFLGSSDYKTALTIIESARKK